MSTNLERERQRKKKADDMLAKLNEKKRERREPEGERKNKGDIFCWENNIKILYRW